MRELGNAFSTSVEGEQSGRLAVDERRGDRIFSTLVAVNIGLRMTLRNQTLFRVLMSVLPIVLGLQAMWIGAAAVFRPTAVKVPGNAELAAVASTYRTHAGRSATIGMFRGDLWTEFALTFTDLFFSEKPNRTDTEVARAAAERALRCSPHDGRAWLLLAALESLVDPLSHKVVAALRMSYYTGPNEVGFIPLRLRVLARSGALADDEIQQLARNEIRSIVAHKPELMPTILAAYRGGSPVGRQFFEQVLRDLNPILRGPLRNKTGGST